MKYPGKRVLWCLILILILSLSGPTTSCRAEKYKDELIEVTLATILDIGEGSVLVLKSVKGSQFLTIGIGDPETRAIVLGLQRHHGKQAIQLERPLTHNLTLDLVAKLGGKIQKIVVSDFKNAIFYAEIFLSADGGKELIIDSRPSDAIALALTMEKPVSIYVVKKVMEEAGTKELIPPEKQTGKPIKL